MPAPSRRHGAAEDHEKQGGLSLPQAVLRDGKTLDNCAFCLPFLFELAQSSRIRFVWQAVQATFRLEEVANSHGKAMDLERDKRLEVTRTLKTSEEDLAKAREELKAMTQAKNSALSGL